MCQVRKTPPPILHAMSLGSSDRDNWPLGFLGKKRALSGKMLEKLIRILNEQIFYCHYFSVLGKEITLIAYQRNGGGLWQMDIWETGWTFRYRRNKAKQIIIIICECVSEILEKCFKNLINLVCLSMHMHFFIGLAGTSFKIMKYKLYSPILRALIIARSTVNVSIILWV